MKITSALLMVAAAAVASAAAFDDWVPPPGYKAYPEGRWCNHGTAGDKGCEAQGENSYCVRHHKRLKHNTKYVHVVTYDGRVLTSLGK